MNFKVFVEATIYESVIMLMTFSLFPHQNKKIIVCLNAECMKFKIFVETTTYEMIREDIPF